MQRGVATAVTAAALVMAGCGSSRPDAAPPTTAVAPSPPSEVPVLLAAGDIASCGGSGDEATAALLAARPAATIITLGDNVYGRGTPDEFADCYEPSWGAHRSRTRPAPGNHDYETRDAAGYFGYFGPAAGAPDQGYYSFDLGSWHVVALNSNCSTVSCAAGSAQEQWLRADLAAADGAAGRGCALAYWHHPRFSSGTRHGSSRALAPLWQALYDHGADLVLAGHEHNYERFAPLDPSGVVDPMRGLRSFVVGTGGRSHYGFGEPITGSEVRHRGTFGVLELILGEGSFDWRFVPVAGESFTDAGTAPCH